MRKEDYIKAIKSFGEDPPAKWTITELQIRLRELQEKTGVPTGKKSKEKTNLQQWMIRLNEAKRKKSALIEFAEEDLGMTLTGSETIVQITQKCADKIYLVSTPSGQDPMGFGCHASLSYLEVVQEHPSYCTWAKKISGEEETSPRLGRFVGWLEAYENQDKQPMDTFQSVPPSRKKAGYPKEEAITPTPTPAQASEPGVSAGQFHAVCQEMKFAMTTLMEEVKQLKEERDGERPRKKSEKPEGSSESHFSMVADIP